MQAKNRTDWPFAPRRLLLVVGAILILLAAILAFTSYNRSYARNIIAVDKIDGSAFDVPRLKRDEGKTAIPKLASACFNPNLVLNADTLKTTPGAVISLSTPGVIGGFNYGDVTYKWTASAGRLTQEGRNARLETRGIVKSTEIRIRVEATAKDGLCRAQSGERVIQVIAPYTPPPSLAIEPGEVLSDAPPNMRRPPTAICSGEKIKLRAVSDLANARYEWRSSAGEASGDGSEAIFSSEGLDPGIYTVTVWARAGETVSFDSIPITVTQCTPRGMQFDSCPRQLPIDITKERNDQGIVFSVRSESIPSAGIYKFAWSSSTGRIFGHGSVAWFDRNSAPFADDFEVMLTVTGDQPQCRYVFQADGRFTVNQTLYSIITPSCEFTPNSTALNPACRKMLGKLADDLKKDGEGRAYIDVYRRPEEIEGFELLRGREIRQYLVATFDIAIERILIRSGGISTWLSDNANTISAYIRFAGGKAPVPNGPAVVFFDDDRGPGGLKFQELVTGSYPNRMEAGEEEKLSIRFTRSVTALPQASPTVTVTGDKTTTTVPAEPLPTDRDLSVALEELMGNDYELWIRANVASSQFDLAPLSPEMSDWRKLAYAGVIDWEWSIKPRSELPLQTIDASVEIEWRPRAGVMGETVGHTLWKETLRIDVDSPLLKQSQIRIATPAFSVAGLACLIFGAWPIRKKETHAVAADDSGESAISLEKIREWKNRVSKVIHPPQSTEWNEAPPPAHPLESGNEPPEETTAAEGPGPTTAPTLAGVPEQPQIADQDLVECSVFAPPSTVPAATIMIQIFAHLREQAEEADRLAREFDEEARRRAVKTLASKIARGSELMFDLHIANWRIGEPVQTLAWNGYPESVQFAVDVPPDCKPGNVVGKVTVSRDSAPIGHISFIIKVGDSTETTAPNELAGIDAKRYSFVFISYASADRSEVLERVQMLEAVGIKYFQDILSLDPGDRWEKKLYKNIDQCDLFLLFWSQHAKDSKWVIKEAEYALARKAGNDDAPPEIKPVIIEGPPIVLPPPSLEHMHFNDKIIYLKSRR